MVSTANLVYMIIAAALLFVLPVLAVFYWKKKHGGKAAWMPLLAGAVGFLVTVRVLELLVHMFCIVLDNPVSRFINGSTAVYVLYGILMAGIFEECGRYVIIRFLMKKNKTKENMVMYGIGHGGIEVWAITLMAVLSYLSIALVLYMQGVDQGLLTLGVTEQSRASFEPILTAISEFGALTAFLYVEERAVCMVLHISLTLIVFTGIQKKDNRYLLLAVAAHALADLFPAMMQRGVVSLAVTEVWMVVCTGVLAIYAGRLYRRSTDNISDLQHPE